MRLFIYIVCKPLGYVAVGLTEVLCLLPGGHTEWPTVSHMPGYFRKVTDKVGIAVGKTVTWTVCMRHRVLPGSQRMVKYLPCHLF